MSGVGMARGPLAETPSAITRHPRELLSATGACPWRLCSKHPPVSAQACPGDIPAPCFLAVDTHELGPHVRLRIFLVFVFRHWQTFIKRGIVGHCQVRMNTPTAAQRAPPHFPHFSALDCML